MAITDENGGNGMVMPVQPMGYGGGYGYGFPMMGGFGGWGNGFGGDGWWILLLLLAVGNGGWGGFGGFGGGDFAFPWLLASNANNQNATQSGFDNLGLANSLNGIQSSINTGFSSAEVANCNRAMDAMQTAYNNQIADLNRSFAAQTAVDNRLDTLEMSLQNCCCENRAGLADLKYTVATENCADRAALSDGIRDILAATQAQTQTILDKMCQQEIDALKTQNAELQTRINMANLAASQGAQTAALIQDNNAQTAALIQRIAPYPTPSYIVGNPYAGYFGYNNGCGCGCGNVA